MINYASFAVSYMRGKMDGQNPNRDMFNNKLELKIKSEEGQGKNVWDDFDEDARYIP